MDYIINKNNILDEFNYNMIFKFYQDIKIHRYFNERKIDSAKMVIEKFLIKRFMIKSKNGIILLNMLFLIQNSGSYILEIDSLDRAKERFDKALEYNNNYPFAYLGLAGYYKKMNQDTDFRKHFQEFNNTAVNADPELFSLVMEEFPKLIMK